MDRYQVDLRFVRLPKRFSKYPGTQTRYSPRVGSTLHGPAHVEEAENVGGAMLKSDQISGVQNTRARITFAQPLATIQLFTCAYLQPWPVLVPR